MYIKSSVILFVVRVIFISADEGQFSINNNKAIQIVNDKFVSFTVDPAIFFAGLSNRPIILKLMSNLSPAYLRIAGSSTQFLAFNADEKKATETISDASTSLTFSPAMWWSINEWIQKTNFTPIFAINDEIGAEEKWNTKAVTPLVDMTAKMNINCVWQLGFDCSKKGFEKYKDDLRTFRQLMDKFPNKKDKWQLLGSDLSKCSPSDHSEILRMYLADLQDADAIIWDQEESVSSSFLSRGVMQNLLSFHEASLPIWLSTSKSEHPITFDDSINWAIEMGEAAKNGFSVIFREPRLQEYYSATPTYWVTVLHKNLMGRNVLDVKKYNEAFVYAHCSRDQNSFSIRGAMTLMIVNNGTEPHKAAFRLPTQIKSVEVRSYILATRENNMDTYLNGEKLTLDEYKLLPKLRRSKVLTHLMLTVPPKSIGFFVLPGAKIPICIDNEDDTQLILEEIDKIQQVDFSESSGKAEGLFSRLNTPRTLLSLADLRRKFEEEFKTDAGLIPKLKLKSQAVVNDEWKRQLTKTTSKSDMAQKKGLFEDSNARVNEMKKLLDKAKMDVRGMDFKNLLKKEDEEKEIGKKEDILGSSLSLGAKPKLDLDLSSDEILRILGDRAKAKLEKKMGFADFELEGFLDKALARKFKRGINMALLEEKVHDQEKKSLIKKPKKFEKMILAPGSAELDGLPDMSKIIPGHEKPSKTKSAVTESLFGNKLATLPKLDLFGIEPLDLPSLLSLLGNKGTPGTSTSFTTTTSKTKFDKRLDLYDPKHDFDRQIFEIEDDLDGHNSFFEHFGDAVSVKPKQHQGFHDLGAAWDFDDGFINNNEFIINDDNQVPETIEKLERYFNAETRSGKPIHMENSNYEYFDPGLDSLETFESRFKRGIDLFHIMKIMKQRRINNKILKTHDKLKPNIGFNKKKRIFPRNAQDNKNQINGYQKVFLRTRLALESNPLSKKFSKSPFNLLKRQPPQTENQPEVYHPKFNRTNGFIKNYKSNLNPKELRPEDILSLPKLPSIYEINERKKQISFDDIPTRSILGKINKRNPRHVDGDINSVENAIDDFLNTIEKDQTFIKPLLDNHSGEYTIVLPTREKLSLMQDKNGDTDIILHRESAKMSVSSSGIDGSAEEGKKDSNQVDSSTCPATDLYQDEEEKMRGLNDIAQEEATTNANDGNIGWQSEDEAIRDEDGRDNDDAKEKRVDRSEYVQKIPAKEKKTKEGTDNKHNKFDFVGTIVNGFSSLWRKLHSKVDSFLKQVE